MFMDKNRKKKLRKIVVNEQTYYWSISDYKCDDECNSKFQIWINKNQLIYYRLINHNEIITPKIVEEIILNLNSNN